MESPQMGAVQDQPVVESISSNHDDVSDEELASLPLDHQATSVDASRKRKRALSVSNLGMELLASNAGFVFELLQNAEDSHFTKAKRQGEHPSIAFRVYHNRIVIDCNEDGFTYKDVKDLCNVAEGSKTGEQRYIGERSIRFKSVFMASSRVCIQSGDCSFYLKSHSGDLGLGKISLIWRQPNSLLPQPLTRMTLFLHDTGDQRETIREQFRDLRYNILFFMRNLREIGISFFGEEDEMLTSTVMCAKETAPNRLTLEKVTRDGQPKITTEFYHVTRHVSSNDLANSETVSSLGLEETIETHSEVVLGFPLTARSVPIVEPEDISASPPVRHTGLPFLILGDFGTQGNWQDIVTTPVRFQGLLIAISDAFIQAVLQFCEHPTLQYTWMRFLPNKDGCPPGSFGQCLLIMIGAKLRDTPVLRPRSEGPLRMITELRLHQRSHLDLDGEPLFQDLTPEIYLSRSYSHDDIKVLQSYEMPLLDHNTIIDLIDHDLSMEPSRMRSNHPDGEWHGRVVRLLAQMFENANSSSACRRLRSMPLLPLEDESWVSQNDGGYVFFAETEGLRIPEDLGLSVIRTSGRLRRMRRMSRQREELLKRLGVRRAPVHFVRQSILQRHGAYRKMDKVNACVYQVCDQLVFLYLTHHLVLDPMQDHAFIMVINRQGSFCAPHLRDVYLPDDDNPFGPHKFLKRTDGGDAFRADAPGMSIDFIHPGHLMRVPKRPCPTSETWQDWLCSYAGLRRHLRLATPDAQDLSEACYYVAKHHPDNFLGFLRHHWPLEGKAIEDSPPLQEKLGNIRVRCRDGQMTRLLDTYLPLPNLEEQCYRFINGTEIFPFIELGIRLEHDSVDWGFLMCPLGVGVEEDLEFYLEILRQIRKTDAEDIGCGLRLAHLYNAIYEKYSQLASKPGDREKLQNFFMDESPIFVSPDKIWRANWATPNQCLWDAPATMMITYSLRSRFEEVVGSTSTEGSNIEKLFSEVLDIPNCTWRNIVDELRYINENAAEDNADILELYRHLSRMTSTMTSSEKWDLKTTFQNEKLIYVEENEVEFGWYGVSECLWASGTAIRGKPTLAEHYKSLREFFVGSLGVETINLRVICDELVRLGSSPSPSVDQVKQQIWDFNSLMATWPYNPDPDPKLLLKARIFPVRRPNGEVELWTADSDFSIADTAPLRDIFAGSVDLLDFTVDEVRRLGPFFQWLWLWPGRYLLFRIKEISTVTGERRAISSPGRRIGPKAHALYRIALHFKSPRVKWGDDVYNMLRNAQVYDSEEIISEFYLFQDGQQHHHVNNQGDLHIQEVDSRLEIFVPRSKKRQEFCYATKLPSRLAEWMMTDATTQAPWMADEQVLRLITAVLNSSRSVTSKVLAEAEIASSDMSDAYLEDDDYDDSEDEDYSERDDDDDDDSDTEMGDDFVDEDPALGATDVIPLLIRRPRPPRRRVPADAIPS